MINPSEFVEMANSEFPNLFKYMYNYCNILDQLTYQDCDEIDRQDCVNYLSTEELDFAKAILNDFEPGFIKKLSNILMVMVKE